MPSRHQLTRFPKHVQAIGMLALETVDLELEMAILFSRILMVPLSVGEAVYMTPLGAQTRIDMLRHAAAAAYALRSTQHRDSDPGKRKIKALQEVGKIADDARKRFDARHRAVHDEWYVPTDIKKPKRLRIDGKLRNEGVPVTVKQIRLEILETRSLIDRITKLAKSLSGNPPQLPVVIASPSRGKGQPRTLAGPPPL
jgi:hypothetical protein